MKLLPRPQTLFAQTSLTVAIGWLVFVIFSASLMLYFVLIPLANRAADDMAALISITATTWASLANEEREQFAAKIHSQHHLILTNADIPLTEIKFIYPFLPRLKRALFRHTGQRVTIKQNNESSCCFWIPLKQANQILYIGFLPEHIGPRPTFALFGILLAGTLMILLITLLLVRRITRPISQLSQAVTQLGKGQFLDPVAETGPQELVTLAQSFNQMAEELRQLLANRNTLFGGISHDLRTPITRMKITVELLSGEVDTPLLAGLHNDLDEMEQLISQTMELVKGLDKDDAIETDPEQFIEEIVTDYRRSSHQIEWQPGNCQVCKIEIHALRRVLSNLLDNAFRYGGTGVVELSCNRHDGNLVIRVTDQGSGIPTQHLEAVFQPFYRLDNSRSKQTGGSGLGLAIVRQLCDAHGWTITLLPGNNGGTEAQLIIPIKL